MVISIIVYFCYLFTIYTLYTFAKMYQLLIDTLNHRSAVHSHCIGTAQQP
jgi:hypothetical protein